MKLVYFVIFSIINIQTIVYSLTVLKNNLKTSCNNNTALIEITTQNGVKLENLNDLQNNCEINLKFQQNLNNLLLYFNYDSNKQQSSSSLSSCNIDVSLAGIVNDSSAVFGQQTRPMQNFNLCINGIGNFVILNSTSDLLGFKLSLNDLNSTLLEFISNIYVLPFVNVDSATGYCTNNNIKCSVYSTETNNICIDGKEGDCGVTEQTAVCPLTCKTIMDTTITTTTTGTTTKPTFLLSDVITTLSSNLSTILLTTTNSTLNVTTIDDHSNKINKHNYNLIILAIVILLVIAIFVVALWIYGKRKRRWREFLAELHNNTDWEYEQLDDDPAHMSTSRTSMTPIFNVNVAQQVNYTTRTGLNTNDVNLMQHIGQADKSHASFIKNQETINLNAISSSASHSTVNERTPITLTAP